MDSLIIKKQINSQSFSLTLNREAKRNALSIRLLEELLEALLDNKIKQNRILFLQAEGPIFSSGLDLEEARDTSKIELSGKRLNQVYQALYSHPSITITLLQGPAYAGGMGLALATDFAIAEKNAHFGFPEVRRGLVPVQIMTMLAKKVPPSKLRELLLLAKTIDCEEAKALGLILDYVSSEKLFNRGLEIAGQIIKGAPFAIKETKALIQRTEGHLLEDLKASLLGHLTMRTSPEAQEGFRAFSEKRPPKWELL